MTTAVALRRGPKPDRVDVDVREVLCLPVVQGILVDPDARRPGQPAVGRTVEDDVGIRPGGGEIFLPGDDIEPAVARAVRRVRL